MNNLRQDPDAAHPARRVPRSVVRSPGAHRRPAVGPPAAERIGQQCIVAKLDRHELFVASSNFDIFRASCPDIRAIGCRGVVLLAESRAMTTWCRQRMCSVAIVGRRARPCEELSSPFFTRRHDSVRTEPSERGGHGPSRLSAAGL